MRPLELDSRQRSGKAAAAKWVCALEREKQKEWQGSHRDQACISGREKSMTLEQWETASVSEIKKQGGLRE